MFKEKKINIKKCNNCLFVFLIKKLFADSFFHTFKYFILLTTYELLQLISRFI